MLIFSFGYLSCRIPGLSLLFRIRNGFVPAVASIYATASCHDKSGRIRLVQTATGLKNFLTLLCSWFLWSFYPFGLPAHAYRCMKVIRICRCRHFRAFCSFEQQSYKVAELAEAFRIGHCCLFPELSNFIELPFHFCRFCIRSGFDWLLPAFLRFLFVPINRD